MPWLFAIDATSTPPAASAEKALAGARNTNSFAAAVPPFVTAVSRLTTARSARRRIGPIEARTTFGPARSSDADRALEVHVTAEREHDRLACWTGRRSRRAWASGAARIAVDDGADEDAGGQSEADERESELCDSWHEQAAERLRFRSTIASSLE